MPQINQIPTTLDNLIVQFKRALTGRKSKMIKEMWGESLLLRRWYSGELVDFGENGQSDLRTIPFVTLLSNFKAALTSRVSSIIIAMWDHNDLLRTWFSGRPVYFDNESGQFYIRTIPLDELVSNFKSVLSSRVPYLIKAIWTDNPILRVWFSGQPVDLGFNLLGQRDIRTISFDDLVIHFKTALSSQSIFIIRSMWEENPALCAWYSGQPVDFNTTASGQPDIRIISGEELVSNFDLALSSRVSDVILAMWDKQDALLFAIKNSDNTVSKEILKKVLSSSWRGTDAFMPQYINWFDNADIIREVLSEMRVIENDKKHSVRITLLQNRLNEIQGITKVITPVNASNKNKASAKAKSSPSKRQKVQSDQPELDMVDLQQVRIAPLSLEALICDFIENLRTRKTTIIKTMWKENPKIRAWFKSKPVNFNRTESEPPDMRIIPLDELISHFKLALNGRMPQIIKAMWDNNPKLCIWFSGRDSEDLEQSVAKSDGFGALTHNFKVILASQSYYIIKEMWEKNPMLRTWYSAKPIHFSKAEGSLEDLSYYFKSALSSQSSYIIKLMWEANPWLRAWFSGQPVELGNHESGQLETSMISDGVLLSHFKSVLSSRKNSVVEDMWTGNERLHDLIKQLNTRKSVNMLKGVINSSWYGTSKFIEAYVDGVDDAKTISEVLKYMEMNCKNKRHITGITVLRKRLEMLLTIPPSAIEVSVDADESKSSLAQYPSFFGPSSNNQKTAVNPVQHYCDEVVLDLSPDSTNLFLP